MAETLDLLTWTASVYPEQRDCFSCHHQTMPSLVLKQADRQGIAVDLEEVDRQIAHTVQFFEQRVDRMRKGQGVPGKSFTAGYALWLFEDNNRPRDVITDAMVEYLRIQQREDGRWLIGTKRPPIEYTDFTATALSSAVCAITVSYLLNLQITNRRIPNRVISRTRNGSLVLDAG